MSLTFFVIISSLWSLSTVFSKLVILIVRSATISFCNFMVVWVADVSVFCLDAGDFFSNFQCYVCWISRKFRRNLELCYFILMRRFFTVTIMRPPSSFCASTQKPSCQYSKILRKIFLSSSAIILLFFYFVIIKTLFTLGLERNIYKNEIITAKDKRIIHASCSRTSHLQARLRETSNLKNANAPNRKRRKLAHLLLGI